MIEKRICMSEDHSNECTRHTCYKIVKGRNHCMLVILLYYRYLRNNVTELYYFTLVILLQQSELFSNLNKSESHWLIINLIWWKVSCSYVHFREASLREWAKYQGILTKPKLQVVLTNIGRILIIIFFKQYHE